MRLGYWNHEVDVLEALHFKKKAWDVYYNKHRHDLQSGNIARHQCGRVGVDFGAYCAVLMEGKQGWSVNITHIGYMAVEWPKVILSTPLYEKQSAT